MAFRRKVEKGLVTLAGRVTSMSFRVDREDSGTVGRSQAFSGKTTQMRSKIVEYQNMRSNISKKL